MSKKTANENAKTVIEGTNLDLFLKALKKGQPFIVYQSTDELATMNALKASISDKVNIMGYSVATGMIALPRFSDDDQSANAIQSLYTDVDESACKDPDTLFQQLNAHLPDGSCLIVIGASRILKSENVQQSIMLCRDNFKASKRSIVFLTSTPLTLPADVRPDCIYLSDALPDEAEREAIILDTYKAFQNGAKDAKGLVVPDLTSDELRRCVSATRGQNRFLCESNFSLSINMSTGAVDFDLLWKSWESALNGVKGLRIRKPKWKLENVCGLGAWMDFIKMVAKGDKKIDCVLLIDEAEKYISTKTNDSSGTSQAILGSSLKAMEDGDMIGALTIGFGGTGKTMSAELLGAMIGVPCLEANFGALKGGIVGDTEGAVDKMWETIRSVGKNVFIICTTNGAKDLPPEFCRRLSYGKWFFDLPSAETIDDCAVNYAKVYPKTAGKAVAKMTDWTPAEVKNCFDMASSFGIAPVDAASYIVPMVQSNPATIEALRNEANGTYLDANKKGVYKAPVRGSVMTAEAPKGRQFAM